MVQLIDNLYGRSYFVIMDRLAIQQIQRGLRRRAQLSNHILHVCGYLVLKWVLPKEKVETI